ncbi:hypothetical protein DFH05DRAFT_1483685 [Lentinula detonsa]|uniref:F-box domain-containing protein n=1 Tax=Lentinula detonsa TaxID=2804962 RepID=A0A9W8TZ83_9AGAR|nr:hypothetical protein DFH05DRAFT_1483685 [Lentinula detonsa]
MTLQSYVRPDFSPLDDGPPQVEATGFGFTSRPIQIFDNSIRYLHKALLGFDADDFGDTDTFPWPLFRDVPGFESLDTTPKEQCSVNHLPVELLRQIFLYSLPDQYWRFHIPPPQLVLAQVCSYWRSVAISYPELWSTFIIVDPIKRHISMTKLWLERAGQHPLTLYIKHLWPQRKDALVNTDRIIGLLLPHAHRWKAATFIFRFGMQSSLLALPHGELPLLETLCFDVSDCIGWYEDELEHIEKIICSSSLPLRQLTWKSYGYLNGMPSLLPNNLTYLCGDFEMSLPFLQSLSKMENLQTLRLYGCIERIVHQNLSLELPVILRRLHTLDVRLLKVELSQFLFDLINAPDLEVLSIKFPFSAEGQMAFFSFMKRSRCYLKAFAYVGAVRWHDPDLEVHFLQAILASPQMIFLSELIVIAINLDPVIRLLAQPIFPSLNRLLFRGSCSGGLLLDLLKHRAQDFPPPTGPLISQPLFDSDPDICLLISLAGSAIVSGFSLCIRVKAHRSACQIEEVVEWCEHNRRPHWNMILL